MVGAYLRFIWFTGFWVRRLVRMLESARLMSQPSTVSEAAAPRAPSVGWWIAAAAFVAFFVLLLFCDLRRPALRGLTLRAADDALVVMDVASGSVMADSGLEAGDRIERVNGAPVRHRLDWLAVDYTLDFDTPLLLDIRRAERRMRIAFEPTVETADYWRRPEGVTLLAIRCVQAVSIGLGLLVLWRRSGDGAGRLGAWLLLTCGVVTVALPYRIVTVWRSLPFPLDVAMWLPYVSSLSIGAILFSFCAVCPHRRLHRPWRWCLVWAPMAVALVWPVQFMASLLSNPSARPAPSALTPLILCANVLYACGAVALLASAAAAGGPAAQRRRAQVLLVGTGLAVGVGLPLVLAYWLRPHEPLRHSLFASPLALVGTLMLLLVPLSLGYAILRHRLFALPTLLRQGLQYALARRVLLSVVPVVLTMLGLDLLVNNDETVGSILARRGWAYAALVGLATVARLRRRQWLDALDRRYFRERYSGERVLREVVDEIRGAPSFTVAAAAVCNRLDAAVHPTQVAVLTRTARGDAFTALCSASASHEIPALPARGALARVVRALRRPVSTANAGISRHVSDAERSWITRAGVELIVPIAVAGEHAAAQAEAMLVLGPRRSDEPYASTEEDLLAVIGEALGVVFDPEGDESALMRECPSCGSCFDEPAETCPRDRATLRQARCSRVVGGRFRLDRRLAEGGMGVVYEGVDLQLFHKAVAIKLLRDELANSDEARRRFEREAQLLAGLTHPHIVGILGFGVAAGGIAFIVMERLEGRTLRAAIDRDGALGPGRASTLLRGVASALDAAHARGIVHRDVKPENVFLVRSGPLSDHPVVLDFGLAQLAARASGDAAQRGWLATDLAGTPEYMSPEQVSGEPASPGWDVWGFVVLAHEVLAGALPQHATAAMLAPPLEALFDRGLSEDPLARPTSAGEFLAQLERVLEAAA